MTRYEVKAGGTVEDDLARLWLDSPDRRAIARAADVIDRELREDASQKGCDAGRGFRQLIISPLIADYTVDEGIRVVTIWSMRHIGTLTNGY
jgi:hypothetical protein